MRLLSTSASDSPLYAALGLPSTATAEEIHAAFLNISRAHHPDVDGDADLFQKAKHAHDILMDPVKRRVYDETGLDPDNDQKMVHAIGLIRNIVAGILNDGKVDIDIVARLQQQMAAELSGLHQQAQSVKAKAERIGKMAANIEKRWSGSPHIKSNLLLMLESQNKVADAERVPLDGAMETVRLAQKLIENARYETDAADTIYWHGQSPFVVMDINQQWPGRGSGYPERPEFPLPNSAPLWRFRGHTNCARESAPSLSRNLRRHELRLIPHGRTPASGTSDEWGCRYEQGSGPRQCGGYGRRRCARKCGSQRCGCRPGCSHGRYGLSRHRRRATPLPRAAGRTQGKEQQEQR